MSQSNYLKNCNSDSLHIPGISGPRKEPIAIIGISCRFPGDVDSLEKFSQFCAKGEEAWSEFPKDRLNADAWYHPNTDKSGSVGHARGIEK